MERLEVQNDVFDLVLMTKSAASTVSDKNKGHISKEEKEYLLPMQKYLLTILKLCKGRIVQPVDFQNKAQNYSTMTIRNTDDGTLQDDIFGELPYVIISGDKMITHFITRDNIPRFLSVGTTINDWMTDKQKKSGEWIEHNIRDKNPAFRLLPQAKPSSTKAFLAKFYRISSEFDTYSIHDEILKILSAKLSEKTWLFDDSKMGSTDLLAYFWLKQQLMLGRLGEVPEESKNLNENYHNLLDFVKRMDDIINNIDAEVHPALSHVAWKDSESVAKALSKFKQRDAVLLDGKVRYYRENTYFKESNRAKYIRLGVSLGFLLFFFLNNKSAAK